MKYFLVRESVYFVKYSVFVLAQMIQKGNENILLFDRQVLQNLKRKVEDVGRSWKGAFRSVSGGAGIHLTVGALVDGPAWGPNFNFGLGGSGNGPVLERVGRETFSPKGCCVGYDRLR